jgi:dolichyl-phosphate-mannose-protein mannosyltransferase
VTPQVEANVIGREERVEYRDQDGNLLNDEQVAALMSEGKAKFETKYETRTRLVDEYGNEVENAYAPDHPDVEGVDPETPKQGQQGKSQPAVADAGSSKDNVKQGKAQPASEASEATK